MKTASLKIAMLALLACLLNSKNSPLQAMQTRRAQRATQNCPTQPVMPEPIWGTMQEKPDQTWWQQAETINPRKEFIQDLNGMTEHEFRTNYKWQINNPFDPAKTKKRGTPDWHQKYIDPDGQFRRSAIFHGKFEKISIKELTDKLPTQAKNNAYFSIVVNDPWVSWETDIRYLQAYAGNKDAMFQIASTPFGPLEGGMAKEDAYLTNMFPHAVQGEEASIATAGATFWRKYCMGTPCYLLDQLNDKLPMSGEFTGNLRQRLSINKNKIEKYEYSAADINKVAIGLHTGVVVTGGYGTEEPGQVKGDGAQQRLPVCTHSDGSINKELTQIVNQAFSFALDVGKLDKETAPIKSTARLLLEASYEGAVKAAAYAEKPRLFLTLVGAGAFRNNIEWLSAAMNRPEFIDTIKKHGLQVTLIYHPDKKDRAPAHRTTDSDQKFFEQMITIYDAINGTTLNNDPALKKQIKNYLQAAYESADKDLMHEYAQMINDQLMLPAKKTDMRTPSTSTTAPPPATKRPEQKPAVPTTVTNANLLWRANLKDPISKELAAYILVKKIGKHAFSITQKNKSILLTPKEEPLHKESLTYVTQKSDDTKPQDAEYRWINLDNLLLAIQRKKEEKKELKNIVLRSRGGAPTLIDEKLARMLWEQAQQSQ